MKIVQFAGCVASMVLPGILLFGARIARAQVTTGDIVGTVTDTSGSAVVAANVVVENVGTHTIRTAQTAGNGDYAVTLLDPGTYTVKVSAPGFKTYTVSSIQLSAGDRTRVDAKLAIGQVSETVTVESQASALQTDSSVVSDTISQKQTEDLPLNERNFVNLVQLTPGVNEGNQGGLVSGAELDDHRQSAEMSINGQSDVLNDEMIDGADNNERLIGSVGVHPSVESIAEVQVQTSDYSADVSRTGGGVINIITKSGTNKVHGSLFEYARNDLFDAYTYDFGSVLPKNELRFNQFGGSLSGPIRKDKTFFFADYEGYRQVAASAPSVSQVPSDYEEANPGDFSDAPCSAVYYWNCATFGPAPLDVAGAAYFGLYPKHNGSYVNPAGATVYTYTGTNKTAQNSTDVDARVDHHFNANNSMWGRYILNRVFSVNPGVFPDAKLGSTGITVNPNIDSYNSLDFDYNGMLNFVHIFSSQLVLELKAGYSFNHNDSYGQNTGKNPNAALGQANIDTPLDNSTALQGILIADTGSTFGDEVFEPLVDHDNTFQYLGSLTYTHGPHTFKFGGALIRRQLTSVQSAVAGGFPLFLSWPDLLQGEYPTMIIPRAQELDAPHLRVWETGYYGEDDWHVNRHLTLNLGLRYDVYTPFTEIANRISTWDPVSESLLIAGQNGVSKSAGIETDFRDGIEPRFGFNYKVTDSLVVRGGFGFSSDPSNNTSSANLKNTPFVSSVNCSFFTCGFYAAGLPPIETTQQIEANSGGPLNFPGVTLDAVAPQFRTSYFEQYNLTLQKEIHGNVATVSYVGILQRRGPTDFPDINEPGANTCGSDTACYNALRPYYSKYPNLANVTEFETRGVNSYNALQASYERRFIRGLAVSGNYTFAHNLGDIGGLTSTGGGGWGQQPNRLRQVDYGNNGLDVRQRLAVSGIYELPFARGATGWKGEAFKGWQYNLIVAYSTGLPYDVLNSSTVSNAISGSGDRPNMSGDPKKSGFSINQYFNTSAFSAQTAGTYGNEPVNPLHGPPFRHADMSIDKTFNLAEGWNLQFRTEAFNISNTMNFGTPNATLGSGLFGSLLGSTSAGYQPRVFQFALKLTF
ncbi:MAG TPA: carboxypeptidase regulatory-like domain-containing protein [Terracidiphilus sp.]|nr:carboxypeptidase regulatory-like domain-containing protein [Terracidiphilus sp.]